MKTFSGGRDKTKPLERSAAIACAGINLLATPGLGTMMGGRFWTGLAQIAVAVVGFGLVMIWFALKFWSMLGNADSPPHGWWQLGLAVFLASWLASAWSSYDMWRNAGPPIPPKLDGTR